MGAKFGLLMILSLAAPVFADEITIFDMRKSLALSDQETIYRDFYLNQGSVAGLRPGMILTVKRRLPLYDSFHNRSAGNLSIAVGRVKIIHVERDLAVARQHSQFSRDDLPLLEDNFIMIGDDVDLSSATTENKMKAPKGKTEESANPPPVEAEKAPEQAQSGDFSVDFASKASDNSTTARPVDGPVVQ